MKPSDALAASGLAREVVAVDRRRGPRWASAGPRSCGWSWSCPRRSGPGSRGSRPARRRGSTPSTARERAVALDERPRPGSSALIARAATSSRARCRRGAAARARAGRRSAAPRGRRASASCPARSSTLQDRHLRRGRSSGEDRGLPVEAAAGQAHVGGVGGELVQGRVDGQPQPAARRLLHVHLGPRVVVEGAVQVDEPDRDRARGCRARAPWPRRGPCARCSRRPACAAPRGRRAG